MGKTKTAFVSGTVDEQLTSKQKYEQKQKKKQELEAKDKKAVGKVGLKGGERIKVVGADISEATEKEKEEEKKKVREPRVRGKKYNSVKKKVDREKLYSIKDAIKLLREVDFAKFDSTVELHMKVKKGNVNLKVDLPHSFGKSKKIEVAKDSTIKALKSGKIDFDILLATSDMMPKLVPFAKLLGPKGLMPNPKTGTLLKDKKDASKFKADALNIKSEKKQPVIHTIAGKLSHKDNQLQENIEAIIKAIGAKQIEKAYLKSTMSPSIVISI